MIIFLKRALLTAILMSAGISLVHARFDQGIVDSYMKMASEGYKIGDHRVHKGVQAANLLAHELALEPDHEKARNMADTLLAMISTGEGIGGISQRAANDGERPLMVKALQEATRCLQAEGALDEAQLGDRLKTFDGAAKDHEKGHLAHVTGIVFGAFKKHAGVVDLPTIKSDLDRILADTVWLKDHMAKDKYWQYVGGYLARDLERRVYNAELKREIDQLRKDEEAADGKMDYKDEPLVQAYVASLVSEVDPLVKNLRTLTDKLKTTVIPAKAYEVALRIFRTLKGNKDLNLEGINFADREGVSDEVVDALIAVETYRMLEITQGRLKETDPDIFVYQGTEQSAESEAILLALVSAVQNYIYNPEATLEDLIRLFKYQINSRTLKKGEVKEAAKAMIADEERITQFINPKLLEKISRLQLKITGVQKLDIDAVAMKQQPIFYSIPAFNSDTFQKVDGPLQLLRYFQSSGSGLQCGFFSLGFPNRQGAIDQIVDNLVEPKILALADRNVELGSAEIRRVIGIAATHRGKSKDAVIESLLQERLDTDKRVLKERRTAALRVEEAQRKPSQIEVAKKSDEDIDREVEAQKEALRIHYTKMVEIVLKHRGLYLDLYAKRNKIDIKDAYENEEKKRAFLDKFFSDYKRLIDEIEAQEKEIDDKFDQAKRDKGMVDIIADDQAHTVSIMRQGAELKKWEAQSRLVKFIYPEEDFQKEVEKSINKKFRNGELEFDPNPDWHLRIPTYPQILTELNGYNIYAWVTKSQFEKMQKERGAHIAAPIHTTEDGEYILVSYLHSDAGGTPCSA